MKTSLVSLVILLLSVAAARGQDFGIAFTSAQAGTYYSDKLPAVSSFAPENRYFVHRRHCLVKKIGIVTMAAGVAGILAGAYISSNHGNQVVPGKNISYRQEGTNIMVIGGAVTIVGGIEFILGHVHEKRYPERYY